MNMMMPSTATGFGLNEMSQNILRDGISHTNMYSLYNNGFTRLGFHVQSQLPTEYASTNFQGREFNNMNMVPVLQYLGQNGTVGLPQYMWTSPDNIPTMSQLTNWGGANGGMDPYTGMPVAPLQQPQQGYPAQPAGYPPAQPQGYPTAQPTGGYPPAQPQGYPPQPTGYPPAQPQGYPPQPVGYGQPYPAAYPAQPQLYPAQPPSPYGLPPGLTPIATAPGQPQVYMAQPIYLGGPPPMMGPYPAMPSPVQVAPPIYMPPQPMMMGPPPMMAAPRVVMAPPIFMR